jgi:hypothetical protein
MPLVLNSLPEVARRALLEMDAKKYEYQSEFARRFYGQGLERGVTQGRVDLLLKLLTTRYGALSPAAADKVRAASAPELDSMAERVLTARTLDEALGAP